MTSNEQLEFNTLNSSLLLNFVLANQDRFLFSVKKKNKKTKFKLKFILSVFSHYYGLQEIRASIVYREWKKIVQDTVEL